LDLDSKAVIRGVAGTQVVRPTGPASLAVQVGTRDVGFKVVKHSLGCGPARQEREAAKQHNGNGWQETTRSQNINRTVDGQETHSHPGAIISISCFD
jgi:hypothetical protein